MSRTRLLAALVPLAALAAAAPATRADPLPFQATLTVELVPHGVFQASGSGTLDAELSGGGAVTGFDFPASVFQIASTQALPSPLPLLGPTIALTSVGAQLSQVAGFFGGTTGFMSIVGALTWIVTAGTVPVPVQFPVTGAFGSVGTLSISPGGPIGIVPIRIEGNRWTLGTAQALSRPPGGATATLTRTGGASTFTTRGAGLPSSPVVRHTVLSYVTPTQITITGLTSIAVFGRFEVDVRQVVGHVPEPTAVWLWLSGAAALAFAARRR